MVKSDYPIVSKKRKRRPKNDAQKKLLNRRDKIIKYGLIGGVSTYVLYRVLKPKPQPPTIGENNTPLFFPVSQPLIIRNDPAGSGEYEARRSGVDGAHQGIDTVAISGTNILAPFDGILKRYANPYEDDDRYFGALLQGTGIYTGYEMKIFYFVPTIQKGLTFSAGQKIGFAQSISQKWGGGMIDHVHIELRLNGQLIDPTPFFF